jgi:hypothetical protein
MSTEGHAKKLGQLNLERYELERYIQTHPNNAGEAYCNLLNLRDEIKSEQFKFEWEMQTDRFADERQ